MGYQESLVVARFPTTMKTLMKAYQKANADDFYSSPKCPRQCGNCCTTSSEQSEDTHYQQAQPFDIQMALIRGKNP